MNEEPREVELKFSLHAARGPEVLAWLGQGRRPSSRALTSIYFDTQAHGLRRAGYALRVRHEGETWMQTIKSRAATGGKLGRGEWEAEVAGPEPDLAAAGETPAKSALPRHGRLEALFTVKARRQAVDIRTPDSVIEACLDTGTIETAGRRAAFEEIELELKAGDPIALFALARRMQDTFAIFPSAVTKADRGYALADDTPLAAAHFEAPKLSGEMTAGEAFSAMARAALDQIIRNAEPLRQHAAADSIHQLRVGTRRLRATLSTFKSVAGDTQSAAIKAQLKWLAGELDPARNLDVFIQGAWRRAARTRGGTAGGPEWDPADQDRVSAARSLAYERARHAAASATLGTLVLDILVWLEAGAWTAKDAPGAKRRDRSVARFAAASLEKSHRRLIEAGAHLARLEPEARHHVRIRAKRLRYAADVFDQLFNEHPKRTKRFLSALETLAGALGDLNDIATARTLAPTLPRSEEILAGEAAREEGLIHEAESAFHDLKAARPYWREET